MTEWLAELQNLIADAMASHKTAVTGAAASTSAAVGAAGLLDLVHTGLSLLAIAAAVISTLALARYHRANERKLVLERKLLEQQLRDRGIDPDKD